MLNKLDNLIFDLLCEPFSQKFQINFGKNCFFLARCLYFLASVTCAFYVYLVFFIFPVKSSEIVVNTAWLIISVCNLYRSYDMQKREDFNQNLESSTMNPERITKFKSRMYNFPFMAAFAYESLHHGRINEFLIFLVITFTQIALYFQCCTPLPPQTGKVIEKINGLLRSLKPAMNHN